MPSLLNLPSTPPSQPSWSSQTELPVLYSSSPLAICFTHGGVYMAVLLSLNSSHRLPSPVKILIMRKSTVHLMLSGKYTEVKEQLISLIVTLYADSDTQKQTNTAESN